MTIITRVFWHVLTVVLLALSILFLVVAARNFYAATILFILGEGLYGIQPWLFTVDVLGLALGVYVSFLVARMAFRRWR